MGRHSGKHGLKARLQELGYELTDKELQKVYELFINLADKKKEVFDEDLRVLMGDEIKKEQGYYELVYININSGTNSIPTATVTIKGNDTEYSDSATGDGSVDALFNAIDRALNIQPRIESYQVRSVTSGRKALGEVIVRIRQEHQSFNGRGVSTDVIEASGKAYIQAINQQEIFKAELALLHNEDSFSEVN